MIRVAVSVRSAALRAALEGVVRNEPELELIEDSGEFAADVLLASDAELDVHDLGEEHAAPAVVLVARDPDAALVAGALRAGVKAVLPEDAAPGEVAAAIHAAAAGLVALQPADVEVLMAGTARPDPSRDGPVSLTPRESEVLQLMAEGLPNKQIAWRLGISEHTAKFHVATILGKLNAGTRAQAVAIGIRRGLILI